MMNTESRWTVKSIIKAILSMNKVCWKAQTQGMKKKGKHGDDEKAKCVWLN